MKYGHFDLENKEYVITRPDTPSPWVNYLGSPEYGAIISNNSTGYSFVKSGANEGYGTGYSGNYTPCARNGKRTTCIYAFGTGYQRRRFAAC